MLEGAADRSVTVVSVGYMTNLLGLLQARVPPTVSASPELYALTLPLPPSSTLLPLLWTRWAEGRAHFPPHSAPPPLLKPHPLLRERWAALSGPNSPTHAAPPPLTPPLLLRARWAVCRAQALPLTLLLPPPAPSSQSEVSGVSGRELVRAKVKQLVIMAGRHRFHPSDPVEWNMAGATHLASVCSGGCGEHDNLGAISNATLSLWPSSTRLVFLDFETGVNVRTGGVLADAPDASPCRRAYEVFCRINTGWCQGMNRCSWDIQALICALSPFESVRTGQESGGGVVEEEAEGRGEVRESVKGMVGMECKNEAGGWHVEEGGGGEW